MNIRRRKKKHEMQGDIWGRGKNGASATRRLTSDREQREAQKDERDNCVNTRDKRKGQRRVQHDGDESTKGDKKAEIRWIYHRSKESTSANQDGEETILQPLTFQLVLLLRLKPRVSGKTSNPNRVTELVVNVHAYFAKASLPAAFHQPLERTANARK